MFPRRYQRGSSGHPSTDAVADALQRPTRTLGRAALKRALSGLAPGGVYLAFPVTREAGGLLHHRFTLTCPAACASTCARRRSILCGTGLRVTPSGRYPPPCSAEPGRSSSHLRDARPPGQPIRCPFYGFPAGGNHRASADPAYGRENGSSPHSPRRRLLLLRPRAWPRRSLCLHCPLRLPGCDAPVPPRRRRTLRGLARVAMSAAFVSGSARRSAPHWTVAAPVFRQHREQATTCVALRIVTNADPVAGHHHQDNVSATSPPAAAVPSRPWTAATAWWHWRGQRTIPRPRCGKSSCLFLSERGLDTDESAHPRRSPWSGVGALLWPRKDISCPGLRGRGRQEPGGRSGPRSSASTGPSTAPGDFGHNDVSPSGPAAAQPAQPDRQRHRWTS